LSIAPPPNPEIPGPEAEAFPAGYHSGEDVALAVPPPDELASIDLPFQVTEAIAVDVMQSPNGRAATLITGLLIGKGLVGNYMVVVDHARLVRQP
jgi:hypothetical protein